ncbi:MAG: PsbP-related protein [Candidatus Spechtbacterales bacterium]|nr:PsbP-related protein [Candidatus Spechtbacterales bacterium]
MFKVIEEKIAVPLMLVITALVLGGIFYAVNVAEEDFKEATQVPPVVKSEKKDPTANWQTYRNEEYGFEFKYPEGWEVGNDKVRTIEERDTTLPHDGPGEPQISTEPLAQVRWFDVSQNSASSWLDEECNEESIETGYLNEAGAEKYESAQCKSKTRICEFGSCFSYYMAYFEDNNSQNRIMLHLSVLEDFETGNFEKFFPVFEQILSTFRFIDTVDTSNWQTYRNEEYGFEIKYPDKLEGLSENIQGDWEVSDTFADRGDIYFGTPKSRIGGYIWGISVEEKANLEELIAQQGSQFTDRKEVREDVVVNGTSALKVTVTTGQYEDWISENIYIERDNKVIHISNGAVYMPEFESFYKSFRFIE